MSRCAVLVVPLLALLFAGSAAADEGPVRGGGRDRPVPPTVLVAHEAQPAQHSLAEAVRRVERQTGGQILSAERIPFDGRDMNRIKVVDSTGRVRVITEDPQGRRRTHDDDGGND